MNTTVTSSFNASRQASIFSGNNKPTLQAGASRICGVDVSSKRIAKETESFSAMVRTYEKNKYGDEYADTNGLGFEPSYMGVRADYNHIF